MDQKANFSSKVKDQIILEQTKLFWNRPNCFGTDQIIFGPIGQGIRIQMWLQKKLATLCHAY